MYVYFIVPNLELPEDLEAVSSHKDMLQTQQRIAHAKDCEIQELRELLDKANAEKRGLISTLIYYYHV